MEVTRRHSRELVKRRRAGDSRSCRKKETREEGVGT